MALINTLREKAGKVVIVFVAFSMFSFILTDLLQSNSALLNGSTDLGEINATSISYEQFQQKVEELSYNFSLNTGKSPLAEDMEQIRQQAWQRFVVENIFFEQYDQLGIEVTESELIDMVQGGQYKSSNQTNIRRSNYWGISERGGDQLFAATE